MRNVLVPLLAFCSGLAWVASAQQPAPAQAAPAYESLCATCHGPDMTGGTGPSILTYIPLHTNAEVADVLRQGRPGMPPMPLSAGDLGRVMADLRALAGTNPTMATGGYTGSRGAGGGGGGQGRAGGPPADPLGRGTAAPAGATGSAQTTAPPAAGAPQAGVGRGGRGAASPAGGRGSALTTITLADGRTLSGRMMAQSDFDATLLAGTRFHLLSKEGGVFREKPIEPKANWLTYDGGITANRYSALDQITRGTIQRLAPAWMFPMVNSPRLEVTPVVVDGIMYVTGWNEIYALDATTGRQLWTYNEPRHDGMLSEAGSGANRGAAVSGDRVFMVMDWAHLVAFNRFTGQKLWDAEMAPFTEGYSATVAPLIVGDLVVQGASGGEEGARGFLDAYRADTGDAWRFYTIPARGEKGSETWIGAALEHGCGATWLTGSYDPDLDLVYWGVGNACPDYTGDERLGDNLYTASVVALSAKTGELKWHYQFTPHETYDWDSTEPMVLVDEPWRGQPRKLLLHGDRNGMFYVLDRTNGEMLLADKLSTKVTWHFGFTPDGKPIRDPASVSTRDGVAVCPGSGGGANWPAASYNPLTKLFYIRVSDSCGTYASHHDPLGVSGDRWFGRGTSGPAAQKALADLLADYQTGNFLRAMDPFTGKKVWDYPIAGGRAGVLSTGGGLVFMGGNGGLMAWDARTGEPVWNLNLGLNSSASPMSYMVGGRQYLALPGTGMIVAYALK